MQKVSGRVSGGRFHGALIATERRPKRGCSKTEELCPETKETCSVKFQAMHEENFLSSWLRKDVEGEEEERERLNKEAKV